MTTYTFNALRFARDEINGESMDIVQMYYVVPEAAGYVFTYDNPVTGRPFVNPDDETGGVNSLQYYTGDIAPDGYDLGDNTGRQLYGNDNLLVGAFEVDWGIGNSVSFMLFVDRVSPTFTYDYILFLGTAGDDDLPGFATIDDFDTWFDTQATGLHPITASTPGFAPGTQWDLEAALSWSETSQDDYVTDTFGHDTYDMGLGEDTLLPLWGDDVITMGSEGGELDWDTLDYSSDRYYTNPDDGDSAASHGINAQMNSGVLTIIDSWGDTDTASGVEQLQGTQFADYVETDASRLFFRFRGFEGDDVFVGHARNYDSIDYRRDDRYGGNDGIVADFRGTTHTVIDGFGDTDTVSSVDYIRGTNTDDTFYGGSAPIRIRGEGGDDTVFGADSGKGQFDGDSGTDTLDYSLLSGGEGIKLKAHKGIASGGNGWDRFEDFEEYVGSDFRDIFAGTTGAEEIRAGDGDDVVRGRGGADEIYGEGGHDQLIGTDDAEYFDGGEGDERVRAKGGDDEAYGGNGADQMWLGSGNDYAEGNGDNDRLFGAGGDDEIHGGAGDDLVDGGRNADLLYGGDGEDVVRGGAGGDIISGGADDDRLLGGIGNDIFVFLDTVDAGRDDVQDWENGKDQLDLTDYGFTDFETQVKDLAVNIGTSKIRIDLTATNQVVLYDMRVDDFDASDVILTV